MSIHGGKVGLVTGGASGIGRAMAEILAAGGARVAIADIDEGRAKESAGEIGGEVLSIRVDVSDEASVEAMVGMTVERFGRLDYAFNNAGISDVPNRIVDFDLASWDRMIAVNMTGVFLCMKHEIRQFLSQDLVDERRGAICNTSSGAGIIPAPGQPHYTAA
ncbi:MAG: SDR family NAD(P)-dependent oxidoreductase, partial [Longimicrobiales bacterium]